MIDNSVKWCDFVYICDVFQGPNMALGTYRSSSWLSATHMGLQPSQPSRLLWLPWPITPLLPILMYL